MLRAAHNTGGHDKGPKGGHRVSLDGLEDCHVVLYILSLDGTGLVGGGVDLLRIDGIVLNLLHSVRFLCVLTHLDRVLPRYERRRKRLVKIRKIEKAEDCGPAGVRHGWHKLSYIPVREQHWKVDPLRPR